MSRMTPRERAIYFLGGSRDPRAVEPLLEVVADSKSRDRAMAINNLARLGDARAVPPLYRLLHDGDATLGIYAADALASLGPAGKDALISVVQDSQPANQKRRATAMAGLSTLTTVTMGRQYDCSLVKLLLDLTKDRNRFVGDQAWQALLAGLRHGCQMTDIGPVIEGLSSKDMGLRYDVANTLLYIRDPRGIDAVLAARKDGNKRFRDRLYYLFQSMGSPRMVPALADDLIHGDPELRPRIAFTLGNIGDPSAIPALMLAQKDPDPQTRNAAAGALASIRSRNRIKAK